MRHNPNIEGRTVANPRLLATADCFLINFDEAWGLYILRGCIVAACVVCSRVPFGSIGRSQAAAPAAKQAREHVENPNTKRKPPTQKESHSVTGGLSLWGPELALGAKQEPTCDSENVRFAVRKLTFWNPVLVFLLLSEPNKNPSTCEKQYVL